MATPTQRRSYENISRKGISRYKGSIRKKDDAVVIIGPITKLMPPHKNTQEPLERLLCIGLEVTGNQEVNGS